MTNDTIGVERGTSGAGKPSPLRADVLALKHRMGQSIVGQEAMIERLLLGLLANGNLLVEGLPGLAKTRAIKSLAKNLERSSRASSSRPTCCHPTSPGRRSTSAKAGRGNSSSRKVRSSPISCSPTK